MLRSLVCLVVLLGGCAAPTARDGARPGPSGSIRAHGAFHTEFSRYLNRLIRQVDLEWNRGIRHRLKQRTGLPPSGATVEVTFTLDRSGRVSIGKVDGSADQLWKKAAVEAITAATLTAGGHGVWTDDMVKRLGERQELVFTFRY